ncbi:alpha/beta hydrolase family protein [Enterovirga aerilata]|uniref:Alpha/beta hydrolase n=1 Tax=Enterovirga aerilata TaxID=2730920 RepID=A0A849I3T6_9HYPH|nr:alpha/beta fold hydrolase [Enterovirga sp. DB1703]NNM72001.1 alpha/beta hydrolase [Enterovirga sp. DB1703]
MQRRFVLGLLACLALPGPALAANQPPQPKAGMPGGADNPDAEIVKRSVGRASAATYVFHMASEPQAARPVVVFLHAWGAVNPSLYGGWIDHLARRGYLVLYPAFQTVGRTRPVDATKNAAALVKDALAALAEDPAARPDLSRVAYLGHSAGGGVAANLAAEAAAADLPVPKLVFITMVGGIASDEKSRGIQLASLSKIDPSTAIITMIGDREFQASDRASRRILREASEVPPNRKLFMRVASDDHGFPSLSATLASPGSPMSAYDAAGIKVEPDPPVDRRAPRQPQPKWSPDMVLSGEQHVLLAQLGRNPIDALDYLAFWKTFDMAADAAFNGSGDLAALRSDPNFLDMQRWSDTWPIRRLHAENPRPVDATATAPAVRAAPAPTKMPVTRQTKRQRR